MRSPRPRPSFNRPQHFGQFTFINEMANSNPSNKIRKVKIQSLETLSEWVYQIDPDVCHNDWFHALAAIHYETFGSEEGFQLADTWSSKGRKYRGTRDVRATWQRIRRDLKKPITLGSLIWLARRSTQITHINN